jgi:tRNA uridine 5-carboxymethylaminomethyl modification enzyme
MSEVQHIRQEGVPLCNWLRRPENSFTAVDPVWRGKYPDSVWKSVEIELKYEGYTRRQQEQVAKATRQEIMRIPLEVDFSQILDLRKDTIQKLTNTCPETLGQAAPISGINPAHIALLSIWIEKAKTA